MDTEKETIINQLLSLPRSCTRSTPACCVEAAAKGLQLSEEADYPLGCAYAHMSLGECALLAERLGMKAAHADITDNRADYGTAGQTIAPEDGQTIVPDGGQAVTSDCEQTVAPEGGQAAAPEGGRPGDAYEELVIAKNIFTKYACTEGNMLVNLYLGEYCSEHAQLDGAEKAFNDALQTARSGRLTPLYGNVAIDSLCGIGDIRMAQSDYDAASLSYRDALTLCSIEGNDYKTAGVLHKIGQLERLRGNPGEALSLLERSAALSERNGDYRTASAATRTIAHIFYESSRYKEFLRRMELASEYADCAAKDEALNEIKSLRSFYVKENARVIANVEKHMKERLFERNHQLEEANWQLNTIYNIGQTITALLDIDDVLMTLYNELRVLMSVDGFFIAAYNHDYDVLEYQVLYENGRQFEFEPGERRETPMGDLAYWCVYNDGALVINDMKAEAAAFALTGRLIAPGSATATVAATVSAAVSATASATVSATATAAKSASLAAVPGAAGASLSVGIAGVTGAAATAVSDGITGASTDYASTMPAGYSGAVGSFGLTGSAVYTRLRTKGRFFGVLCVRSNNLRAYSDQQVKLLDAVSSYVSIALDNATMYQKLDDVSKTVEGLANHDVLTGIPNRRLLMELAPKAYANALRTNSKVAFLFMDLDSFKPINDKYGHQAGDEVLRIFKDRVLGLIRSSDIFARMGGDEFVVIMTDLKINSNAGTLARKIIRETAKPMTIRGDAIYIGVSIGISVYPDDSRDTDVLIVMADEAMYRIKRDTKNSFTFYNE